LPGETKRPGLGGHFSGKVPSLAPEAGEEAGGDDRGGADARAHQRRGGRAEGSLAGGGRGPTGGGPAGLGTHTAFPRQLGYLGQVQWGAVGLLLNLGLAGEAVRHDQGVVRGVPDGGQQRLLTAVHRNVELALLIAPGTRDSAAAAGDLLRG